MGPTGEPPPPPAPAAASVWLDFERPIAAVREVFFDVELAVRANIHRGVRLKWLPRMPDGERRLRQQTRVLDHVQQEEIVIEQGPGGAWIKRFVEGSNAGSRFVATFHEQDGARTRVKVAAFVGPRGFAQGLGKLSPLGLEKAMRRLLAEYKRALEGYAPGLVGRRTLEVVAKWTGPKASMMAMDAERRRAVTGVLIETAWSIAAVDDEVDTAEKDAMKAIVAGLWDKAYGEPMEERMARAALGVIGKQGARARCEALGAKLKALGVVDLGIAIAVLVAEVSHGLDPAELVALRHLAAAAGMPEAELLAVVGKTDEDLSGAEEPSRMSTFV